MVAPRPAAGLNPVQGSTDILHAAEQVLQHLQQHQLDAVVIGAVALAAHRYVRHTEDLDLGTNADLERLRAVTGSLRAAGYHAELREPDADDPLGGVIDVEGPFGILQIISFAAKFPAVIDDALREARMTVREGSPLKLIPLPHLIALKLYAGGSKSKADIVELLLRNPNIELGDVRKLCSGYRLKGLETLISEARAAS